MSSTAIQLHSYSHPASKVSGPGRLWVILLIVFLFSFTAEVVGQNGVTISSPEDPGPTQQNPVKITFEFDEPINEFELQDINRSGGVLDNFYVEAPEFGFEENLGRMNQFRILIEGDPDTGPSRNAVLAFDFNSSGRIYSLTLDDGVYAHNSNGTAPVKSRIISANNFSDPRDIALDSEGNIYVADSGNDRIRVYTSAGNHLKDLEGGLNSPFGVVVGPDDKIYVADSGNDRIVIYEQSGAVDVVITGSGVQTLDNPIRLAVDEDQNVYVNDIGHNRVQIFNSDGDYIGTISNANGNNIQTPGSIVVDENGFIYIADLGNVNFEDFLDFENADPLSLLPLITGTDASVKVFRRDDLDSPPGVIDEKINIPVDLAFKPCGYLAVNNADASLKDEWDFSGWLPSLKLFVEVIFDAKTYNILPNTFTADLTIADECVPATISVPAGVGEDAECNSTPDEASNDFSLVWDETAPVIDCLADQKESLDENGEFKLPDYTEGIITDNCTSLEDLIISQSPAAGTFITVTTDITITAEDEAGNTATVCPFQVIIEDNNTPPEAICNSFEVALDDDGNTTITAEQVYGGDEDLDLSVSVESLDCTNLGPNTVILTVTDRDSGLTDTCEATITVVDEIDPDANCFPPFKVILNEDGEASITVAEIDNGSTDNCGITTRALSQYDFTRDDVGVVPVTLTITDTSGLTNTCTVNITVETPPEAICNSFEVALDDDGNAAITAGQVYGGDEDLELNIHINSFDCSDLGENTVILTVTDQDTGLTDTCEATITVVDEIDPVANCFPPFTVFLNEDGEASITVADVDNGSSDNCEIESSSLSQYNFTRDDVGVVPVTLTITDTSGRTNTCTVDITVENTPPEAICNNFEVALDDDGNATITAEQVYGGDEELGLNIDINSFNCSKLGENTVVLTVTDQDSGLTDTCEATITVVDEIDPVANCFPPFTVFLNEDGEASITVADVDNGSSDNCEIESSSLSQYNFTRDDVGVVPVTLTITDTSGRTNTCTVDITVENTPPEAVCNSFEVALDENGKAEITAEQVYGGDEELGLNIDISSFDCSKLGWNTVVLTVTDPDTGLTDTCKATITVVDKIAPTITCPAPRTETFDPAVCFTVPDYRDEVVVSDNCTSEAELRQNIVQDPAPGETIYVTQQIFFSVDDAAGNVSGGCSFTITLNENPDEVAPTFVDCPSVNGMTQEAAPGECEAVVHFPVPEAIDSEGNPVAVELSGNLGPGDNFPFGPTEVVFSATDENGLSATCSFTVTIIDNEPPVIAACASPKTVNFDPTVGFTVPDYRSEVVVSDICTSEAELSQNLVQDPAPGEIIYASQQISFTVEDAAGMKADCSFELTLEEGETDEPLEFTTCPGPKTGTLNEYCSYKLPDYTGEARTNIPANITQLPTPGSPITEDTNVSIIATTSLGEAVVCYVQVNVDTTLPEMLNCPPGDIEADYDPNQGYFIGSYISRYGLELCDRNFTVVQTPESGTPITGDTTVTISVRDNSGRETSCEFTVFVPGSDPDKLIARNDKYEVEDNSQLYFVSQENGILNNDDFNPEALPQIEIISPSQGAVDMNPDGSFTYNPGDNFTGEDSLTYRLNDGTTTSEIATVTFNVSGEVSSDFACVPEVELQLNGAGVAILTPQDLYTGDPGDRSFTLSQTNFNCDDLGENEVIVTYEDGNCTVKVIVKDEIAPTISCSNREFSFSIQEGETFTLTTEKVDVTDFSSDNCEIVDVVFDRTEFTYADIGIHTIGYTVFDAAGNSDTCQFDLNLDPYSPGEFQCLNDDVVLQLDANGQAELFPHDLYTGDPGDRLFILSKTNFDCSNLGENVVTYSYIGDEGAGSCSAKVIVKDEIAPTISCSNREFSFPVPEGETFTLTTEKVDVTAFSRDNCEIVEVVFDRTEFSYADIGIHTIGYTVFDAAGNSDTCEFDLHLEPYSLEDFECVGEVVLQLDENGQAELFPEDLYNGEPGDREFTLSKINFDCSNLGENVVTVSYSGSEGAGSCSVNVIVKDEIAPVVLTNDVSIFLDDNGRATLSPSTIDAGSTDNCGEVSLNLDKTNFSCKDLGETEVTLTVTDASGNSSTGTALVTLTGTCEGEEPDEEEPGYIFIYPNPTSGLFNFSAPRGVTISRVEAYDYRARFILAKDFPEGTGDYQMDITGVEQAVYILKLFTSRGIKILRVIKH